MGEKANNYIKISPEIFFSINFLILVLLLIVSPSVYAVFPDISGTYNGTLTENETSCATTPTNSTETASFSLTITKLTETTFHGDGLVTFADGDTDDIGLDITLTSDTTFVFIWDATGLVDNFQANGSGSGTITSSGVTISGAGIETSSPSFCHIDFTSTLTKSGGATTTVTSTTPSSTVTDTILFNTQIQSTVSDISKHITSALSGIRFFGGPRIGDNEFRMEGLTGLNAGDSGSMPYGVWGNYSYTDYENDLSSTAFDGTSHSVLGGVDIGLWDSTVLGVAFGFDNSDIDTTFNGGNQNVDSFTIAPYFGALLNDILSVDFNIGYSRVDYDQYRTITGTTTRVTSSPNADRWFGSLNLNAIKIIDRWIIGGRVGALYASSVIDSFTESNGTVVGESRTKVGTASIAGDVAYGFGDFEPFLNLSYQYDFQLRKVAVVTGPQPSNDKDDILLTAGVRYFEKSGISGNLEYSKRLTRDDFDEDRVSITVRVDY